MKIFNFKKMKGGWFVGDFLPTAFKTKNFEVSYKFPLGVYPPYLIYQ